MFIYRHHRRYWVEFPALPNRDNSSRLAIQSFHDVGVRFEIHYGV